VSLRVTPFAPHHYARALEAIGQPTPWIEDRLAYGRGYATYGPSYTIWAGEAIACVLGVLVPWPGRGLCWAVWTPAGYPHGAGIHRLTIRYLRRIIRQYRIRRLEADVIGDFEAGRRWVEHLGFDPEGPLKRHYGPQGESMQGYVWYHPRPAELVPETILGPPEAARRADGTLIPAIAGGYGLETLAIIGAAAAVAGAGVSAYASYEQGQAQRKAYKYNAAVTRNQAEIAQQQAAHAARQQRERDRRIQARARAIQGISGVEVGEGSSLLVDIDNARQAELNAQAAKYEAEARRRNMLAGAELGEYQGGVAAQQATIGAGATLLSGLGSAASGYGSFRQRQKLAGMGGGQPTGVYVPQTTASDYRYLSGGEF
jgi:hypothetical protein